MTQGDDVATDEKTGGRRRGAIRFWGIISASLGVAGLAGAAGYWYFALREPAVAPNEQAQSAELPLPYYLEIKPFVVSITNSAGTPHFVQLGLNLTVSGSNAGNAVTALLPEIQDAVRQTALGFKVDDIVSPEGVDKMREAMVANANRALLRRLGAERVKRLASGEPDGRVVQNIYFSTLIVE
jgi:flagellar basal body-associated protein FliL